MVKTKCRPERVSKKSGRKTVEVQNHKRSKPRPIGRKCR